MSYHDLQSETLMYNVFPVTAQQFQEMFATL